MVCSDNATSHAGPAFPTGEEHQISNRTNNNSDNGNLNDIDTVSKTANGNTQLQFDCLFFAINHLAQTVSQLTDKVGNFEESQNQLASHIDQRVGISEDVS